MREREIREYVNTTSRIHVFLESRPQTNGGDISDRDVFVRFIPLNFKSSLINHLSLTMDVYGLTSFHQWCTVFCRDIKQTVELSSLYIYIKFIYFVFVCLCYLRVCLFPCMHTHSARRV